MVQDTGREESLTRQIVEELFDHSPVNEAELEARLGEVDVELMPRILVQKLFSGNLNEKDGPLFLAILSNTGLGDQKHRLTQIALDGDRDAKERLWASMALTAEDPRTMDMLVGEIGPEGMESLAELSLFELIAMQDKSEIGSSIASALETLLDERPKEELFARLEVCRQSIGASCALAYGESLTRKTLAHLRPSILSLFVEEASDDGIRLLEMLRDEATGDGARRTYQSTLLRLRSKRIDPRHREQTARGYALISNCDGQGGFVLLGVFDIADGTHSVADICIRAGGDIRDGYIYPRRLAGEVDEFVARARRQLGCHFTRIQLAEAAELVRSGVQRTKRIGSDVPDEASTAVALFEGVGPSFRWGEGRCVAPALDLTEEQITDLLSRPEYDDTWFFDVGDLGGFEAELPKEGDKLRGWIESTARRLDAEPLSTRLVAMSEHMARWHMWFGQEDLAALCLAMSDDVNRGFHSSALVRVMLARSAEAVQHAQFEPTYQFGDPAERQRIKTAFFQHIDKPCGRDLARLDLTEAASAALEAAFEMLPSEKRPREDERDSAAFAIGTIFAEHLMGGFTPQAEATVDEMSKALTVACRLTTAEQHNVLMSVVPSLYAFVEDICTHCPTYCLDKQDEDVSDVFFRPQHPISIEELEE